MGWHDWDDREERVKDWPLWFRFGITIAAALLIVLTILGYFPADVRLDFPNGKRIKF